METASMVTIGILVLVVLMTIRYYNKFIKFKHSSTTRLLIYSSGIIDCFAKEELISGCNKYPIFFLLIKVKLFNDKLFCHDICT